MYQTPKKLKVGTLLEALSDTMPIGLGKAEEVSRIIDPGTVEGAEKRESVETESLRTVLAEWNKLGANFELFNAEFENLGNGEEKYRDAISTMVVRIHEAMRDTDARVALLAAWVGEDVTEASDMGSDSVWDAIRNVCNTMDDVQEDGKGALKEIPKLAGFSTDATIKLGTLSENFHGLRNYAQDSFMAIQSNPIQSTRD
jgi:hypothetical protein